jgi:TPR repeat protein
MTLIRAVLVMVCLLAGSPNLEALPQQTPDIASFQKQAKDGDAEAQFLLANAYLSGNGVPKDAKKGVEWLEKAALLEHAPAQYALWIMYRDGLPPHIPKDPKKGLEWLQKSAEHGYATSEYNLAILYRDGDGETGIPRKPKEAAIWFRKAARQPGSDRSRASLEEMFKKGLISKQEANWRESEPKKETVKSKAMPFSLDEVEKGLSGGITSKRMATLVDTYGVNFRLTSPVQERLKDAGAGPDLLNMIFKRSLRS